MLSLIFLEATRATGVPLHSTHGHGPVWSGAGWYVEGEWRMRVAAD